MHICPYCKKPGIGYVRKNFIATWWPATCKNCGNKVHNNALKAVLSTLPFFAIVIASGNYTGSTAYAILAAGVVVLFLLNTYWVTLEKDKDE